MALLATQVWEVRSAGSDNNGGGFDSTGTGTDFSKQDAAEDSGTDLTIDITTNTIVTSATHNFVAADVGNLIQITAGVGYTTGFYRIVSVAANAATLDRSPGAVGIGGGTWALGGALATLNKIGAITIAGNTIWVKGSFTLGVTDTMSVNGTSTNPIRIIGYGTTRGDGYLGRTNGNGALIATNMPTLTYSSTFRLSCTGNFMHIETLKVVADISGYTVTTATESLTKSCIITNSNTGAGAGGWNGGSRGIILDCDVSFLGASGGTTAVNLASTTQRCVGNRIKGGTAPGINSSSIVVIVNNVIYGSTVGITVTASSPLILGNTIVGNTGDGIDVVSSTVQPPLIVNNLITDNGGYGIDLNAATVNSVLAYNRFRDNTAGNVNSGGLWASQTSFSHVTTDTGGAETDYVNSGSNDYRLIPSSPAKSVGIPAYRDIGALQHQDIPKSSTFS